MNALNLTAKEFCALAGISHRSSLMAQLRELDLVKWFSIGKKRMYCTADAHKISEMLYRQEIAIRVSDNKYLIEFLKNQ